MDPVVWTAFSNPTLLCNERRKWRPYGRRLVLGSLSTWAETLCNLSMGSSTRLPCCTFPRRRRQIARWRACSAPDRPPAPTPPTESAATANTTPATPPPPKTYNLNLGSEEDKAPLPVRVQWRSFWNVPNVLTMTRIVYVPVLTACFYFPVAWSAVVCATLFLVAALTDWLDGYVARQLGVQSAWGSFLDPVADKLMVTAVLVLLTGRFASPTVTIPAAAIILRELAVSALREWMAMRGEHDVVAVGVAGKWKTSVQMVALLVLLLAQPGAGMPLWLTRTGVALLYTAAWLSVVSAAGYFRLAAQRIIDMP
ncbi:hypothetical protein CDCA_CDCA08G2494 [Cyanidium caldarium]|uniref:CDP-diacylglycerol--glycerol-3-phosphate 3-phosphatidyltransferase n=1 Tax=Cyanidium caldarium TaxID=2771 RepID=A0AAV9IW05_CYACA|nr:hypothetical protein CDCA_CDCA08G2494 [Cyanidium caldarium]